MSRLLIIIDTVPCFLYLLPHTAVYLKPAALGLLKAASLSALRLSWIINTIHPAQCRLTICNILILKYLIHSNVLLIYSLITSVPIYELSFGLRVCIRRFSWALNMSRNPQYTRNPPCQANFSCLCGPTWYHPHMVNRADTARNQIARTVLIEYPLSSTLSIEKSAWSILLKSALSKLQDKKCNGSHRPLNRFKEINFLEIDFPEIDFNGKSRRRHGLSAFLRDFSSVSHFYRLNASSAINLDKLKVRKPK